MSTIEVARRVAGSRCFLRQSGALLLASVHEDFELHSADPGVLGVVSDVPGPDLAVHRDRDAGGQVVELNEYVWAEKVSNPR